MASNLGKWMEVARSDDGGALWGKRVSVALLLAVAVATVGCDGLSKRLAVGALAPGVRLSLLGDLVRLERVENRGAFLSLGERLPAPLRTLAFVLLPPLAAALALVVVRRQRLSSGRVLALGLLVGGGAGNWIDRVWHGGAVTDFLNVGVGGLRTGIFNVADMAILVGVAMLARPPRPR